LGGHSVVNIQD